MKERFLRRKGLGLTAALLTAVVTVAAPTSGAHAYVAACRSDPVVLLSNLGTLDLSASIADSMSDVQRVVYTVHVPAGLSEVAVVNTDSLIGLKETVQFSADNSPNTFDVYTTVYTGQSHVAVTATASVVSALNLVLGLGRSTSGYSGSAIHVHFTTLL